MKIQPIDMDSPSRVESGKAPVLKSRLKRLFDRPFTRSAASVTELEPSSVCLAKMVQNFMEESNEKQGKCGGNRCNCFNDELDLMGGSAEGDASDHLLCVQSLIPCASAAERNLLADAAKIVEKNKSVKRKEEVKKMVNQGLLSLGYDSSICKSRWDKSPSFPAGEYEYIDVIIGEERLLVDVDFRSEFDIARQTSAYKALLQSLPSIFVGKPDRLSHIVSMVSEAAKQSLKKKGMHLPPWRKAEYMRSKWLSSYTRPSRNAPPVFEDSSSPLTPNHHVLNPALETQVKPLTGLASLFKKNP